MLFKGGTGRRTGLGRAVAVAAIAASVLSGGCTRKYTDKIDEQDRTIQRLRDEAAQYDQSLAAMRQNEEILNRTLETERQRHAALSDELAAARSAPAPARTSGPAAGGLDDERSRLEGALRGSGATVDVRDGQLVVTLPTTIAFASGSATLTTSGESALAKVSRLLKENYGGRTVSIEGHTDDEPVKRSKYGTNWRLSVERAMAVQRYLEEKCSVPPQRLRVVGYGPYRPVTANTTASAKQKNRRVELVILSG